MLTHLLPLSLPPSPSPTRRFTEPGIDTDHAHQLTARFGLTDTEQTRNQWPFAFRLVYTVTLTERSLTTALTVVNKTATSSPSSSSPSSQAAAFPFTVLLHTYLQAATDLAAVKVVGLQGLSYKVRREGVVWRGAVWCSSYVTASILARSLNTHTHTTHIHIREPLPPHPPTNL